MLKNQCKNNIKKQKDFILKDMILLINYLRNIIKVI